ncbi:MAG: hypothetical protein A2Y61_00925 [Chloroflexi bacterium RBG_13_60_13]|nr:MAG: hypothetical protein A2Y61_00925 [Chloroflexi bacterium RBG_13_60_13]
MMDEKFVRKLLSNMKCGICGCQYESSNIKILGHREDLWFLSVFCPSCKSQGLVAAVVKDGKAPEILTELTEDERRRLSIPVNSDDLIEMYGFLREFNGDFSSLFAEE